MKCYYLVLLLVTIAGHTNTTTPAQYKKRITQEKKRQRGQLRKALSKRDSTTPQEKKEELHYLAATLEDRKTIVACYPTACPAQVKDQQALERIQRTIDQKLSFLAGSLNSRDHCDSHTNSATSNKLFVALKHSLTSQSADLFEALYRLSVQLNQPTTSLIEQLHISRHIVQLTAAPESEAILTPGAQRILCSAALLKLTSVQDTLLIQLQKYTTQQQEIEATEAEFLQCARALQDSRRSQRELRIAYLDAEQCVETMKKQAEYKKRELRRANLTIARLRRAYRDKERCARLRKDQMDDEREKMERVQAQNKHLARKLAATEQENEIHRQLLECSTLQVQQLKQRLSHVEANKEQLIQRKDSIVATCVEQFLLNKKLEQEHAQCATSTAQLKKVTQDIAVLRLKLRFHQRANATLAKRVTELEEHIPQQLEQDTLTDEVGVDWELLTSPQEHFAAQLTFVQ